MEQLMSMTSGETLPDWLVDLGELFEKRLGHAIPQKGLEGLAERVSALANRCGLEGPARYVALARSLPMQSLLVQALLHETVNKESYFFRDPSTVASLKTAVLPRLIDVMSRRRRLRVWSAGCSTGEEIHTLAILLDELVPDRDAWNVTLVGTDIDSNALTRARRGEYREWALRTTTDEERRRYFTAGSEPGWFRLRPRYKKNVSFAFHNLADAQQPIPWPGSFDLILCRNVSIYFSRRASRVLARKLFSALAPHGSWIAGPSDPGVELATTYRVLPGLVEYRLPQAAEPAPPQFDVPAPATPSPVQPLEVTAVHESLGVSGTAPAPQAPEVPVDLAARLEDARTYANEGNFALARSIVDDIIGRGSMCADPYLLSAVLHEAAGDDERAANDLRRLLYLDPASIEGQFRMALVRCRQGDRSGAISSLRNTITLSATRKGRSAHEDRFYLAASCQLAALLKGSDND